MADGKTSVVKAYEVGDEPNLLFKAEQSSTPDPSDATYIGQFQLETLQPPYDPVFLGRLYEHANSLRQNIDAYRTNIDGFGHVFEPIVELRESGAREVVADSIYVERAEAVNAGGTGSIDALEPPTDEEIDKRIETLRTRMRVERARVESFFDNCVAEESFVSLRKKTREDLEATGNGYWEVIRSDAGAIAQFAYMPSRSVRVTKVKSESVQVTRKVRLGPMYFREETYRRKFRTYVQIGGPKPVYFKEFGDPSVVSGKTGKRFVDDKALLKEEGKEAIQANEVIHFKVHSIRNGAYGVPRWIGNLLSVLGSRSAEEVNLAYFDNKSIPPMAILVSGGRLGDESVRRIQDYVETHIKGKGNFHKILVIEAETSAGAIGLQDNAASMKIEIKQLTDALLKDGLFLEYDAANLDKVGMGFRMPRLLRGDIRDFNRASAQSALDFAESQVFLPERADFDFMINRFIMPELGIQTWRFKSLGPRLSDSQDWGEMIAKLTIAGILTPQDARELTGKKVLESELPLVQADWTRQPLALTIAGVPLDQRLDGLIPTADSADPSQPTVTKPNPTVTPPEHLLEAAKRRVLSKADWLLSLRDEFRKLQAEEAVAAYKADRASDDKPSKRPAVRRKSDKPTVVKMSRQEMIDVLGVIPDEKPGKSQ